MHKFVTGQLVKVIEDTEHLYRIGKIDVMPVMKYEFIYLWVDKIGTNERRVVEDTDIDINVTDRDKLRLL